MKRKDLSPGMPVEVRLGMAAQPAVIVDTRPWRRSPGMFVRPHERFSPVLPNERGGRNGVAVALDTADRWRPEVVPLSQIDPVGTDAKRARQRAAEYEENRARDLRRKAQRLRIAQRLVALGVRNVPHVLPGTVPGTVTLPIDEVAALLDMAERKPMTTELGHGGNEPTP